jgi:hypothetical protein
MYCGSTLHCSAVLSVLERRGSGGGRLLRNRRRRLDAEKLVNLLSS